jgi:hypothetical protein
VRSWHLQKSGLLRYFSDMCLLKEIIHIKSYFANVATITAGTTTIIRTRLPERHVLFRHLESETKQKQTPCLESAGANYTDRATAACRRRYKIIDVFIVTHLSLLKHYNLSHFLYPAEKKTCHLYHGRNFIISWLSASFLFILRRQRWPSRIM